MNYLDRQHINKLQDRLKDAEERVRYLECAIAKMAQLIECVGVGIDVNMGRNVWPEIPDDPADNANHKLAP